MEVYRQTLTKMPFLGLAIALVPFLFYVNTLNPSLPAGDSPEFATASYVLGIPHNSGYPLYSLLGKLATLLPLGNIVFRINLASAVYIYVTLVLLFYLLNALIPDATIKIFCVLMLAFAPSIWEQAVGVEVYALHLLFISLILVIFFVYIKRNDKRFLLLLSFVSGLSFSNHLQSYVLIFPLVLVIMLQYKKRAPSLNDLFICLVLFIMGLSVYGYLPIRAQKAPFLDWGNPENIKNFLYHVTAVEHRSERISAISWDIFLSRGKEIFKLLYQQFGVLLPVIGLGLAVKYRQSIQRRELIVLSLMVLLDCFYTLFLNLVPFSVTPFNLTTIFIFAPALALGLKPVRDSLTAKVPLLTTPVALVLCLSPIVPLSQNYSYFNYKENYLLYDHGQNIMKTVPEKSFLFTMGDNSLFPLWYLAAVERNRSDLLILDKLLLDRDWYWEQLAGQYPLVNLSAIKSEVFRKGENSFLKFADYLILTYKLKPYSLFNWPDNWDESKIAQPSGIVFRFLDKNDKNQVTMPSLTAKKGSSWWDYYSLRGIFDGTVPLDPMTAEVLVKRYAYFFFKGSELYERIGEKEKATEYLKKSIFLKKLNTIE